MANASLVSDERIVQAILEHGEEAPKVKLGRISGKAAIFDPERGYYERIEAVREVPEGRLIETAGRCYLQRSDGTYKVF